MVVRLVPIAFQRHGGRVGSKTLKTTRTTITINRTPQTSFFTTGAPHRAQQASSSSSSSAYAQPEDYYYFYNEDTKPFNAGGSPCFHQGSTKQQEQSSYQHDHASSSSTSSYGADANSGSGEGATITEQTILNSFPRPNLSPTLHFTVLLSAHGGSSSSQKQKTKKKCDNCAGPHSTEFCPC